MRFEIFFKIFFKIQNDHTEAIDSLKKENKKLKLELANQDTKTDGRQKELIISYISKLEDENLILTKKVDTKQIEILKKEKSISRLSVEDKVKKSIATRIKESLDDEIPMVESEKTHSLGRFVSDGGYNSDEDSVEVVKDIIKRAKENDSTLMYIQLSKSNLKDEDVSNICQALAENTFVISLDFSYNDDVKGDCMDDVVGLLSKSKYIEEIFFEGCPVRNFEVKKLISTLRKNETLLQCTGGLYETDMDIDTIEALLDRNYERKMG
jgi:hypothetical protein